MIKKISTFLFFVLFLMSPLHADSVLVEAENFDNLGGWVVDQQFTDQMGSPYLLAHGMGEPVADAKTEISFPSAGKYKVWVRTKNWVLGPWDAPGRFKVLINGSALKPTFGTEAGWNWQDGGIVDITEKKVTIMLKDLTGFDGRCDGIYFDTDISAKPIDFDPNNPQASRKWRNNLRGLPETPPDAGDFDVIIVGGGISGCAAALAADKVGLKVALIHDRMLFGGNASSEVRVHAALGLYGHGEDILSELELDTPRYPYAGYKDAVLYDAKREKTMTQAKNVTIFRPYHAYNVNMKGSKITSVDASCTTTGRSLRFRCDVFIDCTGDGSIGYWAGAQYRYGRESKNQYDEGWKPYGDIWSPSKPDNRVMGASVLWDSRVEKSPSSFPEVPWALDVAKGKSDSVHGHWYWEYSSNDKHQVDDGEYIRDHMLRAIYGSFYNAKQLPKNAKRKLDWVSYLLGKRESRRLIGDYILKQSDIFDGTVFEDAVAEEDRTIDVHYQRNIPGNPRPLLPYDFISNALYRPTPGKLAKKYHIPFRCLYSKNIDNLMMAGRCLSTSHVALGGPRIMKTCGQMGIATGYAASLCNKYKTTPRGVYKNHMPELKALIEK